MQPGPSQNSCTRPAVVKKSGFFWRGHAGPGGRPPVDRAPNDVGDHGWKDQSRWSPLPGAPYKGMRIGVRWTGAYSLSLRFGLPGSGHDGRRPPLQRRPRRVQRHHGPMPPLCGGCGRLEGEPSQVEAHLGCASDLPRLSGPWMGWFSRRRIPSGLLRLTRVSPGGRAIAGRGTPWLCLRPAKAVGAMDGLVFAPAHPFGPASAYASLAWKASHRRSRHTLAVPPTCQGCRGHGWPDSREVRCNTSRRR
jgi:hypothetical protein